MRRLVFLFLLVISASPAFANIVKVQSKATDCGAAATTCVHTMTSSPANGDTLVMGVCLRNDFDTILNGAASSVTQAGANWHRVVGAHHGNGLQAELWYADGLSGAGTTITLDWDQTRTASGEVVVAAYSGLLGSSVLDVSAKNDGGLDVDNSAFSGTTATTTQADELLIGILCARGNNTFSAQSGSPSSGWTEVHDAAQASGNAAIAFESNIVSATVAASSTATISGSISNNGVIGAFKAAAPQTPSFIATISKAGAGVGTVTDNLGRINCGVTCSSPYDENTSVNLSGAAGLNSAWNPSTGWSGDTDCLDGALVMTAARACTATFTRTGGGLTITVVGSGTVTSTPAGIACPGDCLETYAYVSGSAQTVQLAPMATAPSVFAGWSGDADCSDGIVTMDKEVACTATFNTPTAYHVRDADGCDAGCTGLANAAYSGTCASLSGGTGQTCAFKTIQPAINAATVNNCAQGNDVTVYTGHYVGMVTIPAGCAPGGANGVEDFVLQGDPAVARTAIIIEAGVGDIAAIRALGDAGSGNRSYRTTIKHMNIWPGTKYGILWSGQRVKPQTEDILFDHTSAHGICCPHTLFPDVALISHEFSEYPIVINNAANGDATAVLPGPPATPLIQGADVIFDYTSGIAPTTYGGGRVSGNVVRGLLGSFVSGNPSYIVIENNDVAGSAGHGDDGALVQMYNTEGTIIRYNLFQNNLTLESTGSGYAFRVRVSSIGDRSWGYIYNNTLVGFDSSVSGVVAERKGVFERVSNTGQLSATNPASVLVNNLIIRNHGKGIPTIIPTMDLGLCSSNQDNIDYNWFWENGWNSSKVPNNTFALLLESSSGGGCPAPSVFNVHSTIGVNPVLTSASGLNTATWDPLAGSPLCGAGTTSFTAPDGDVSKSWIGAKQGICGGVAPPTRTLTVITAGTGAGNVTGNGISCATPNPGTGDCTEGILDQTIEVLTATQTDNGVFAGFSGTGCASATSPISVTMSADRTCTATFNAPTCFDSKKNGTETDQDCGGACALKCVNTKICATGSDCASGRCDDVVNGFGTCRSCSDGVKSGDETCIDGGGVCGAACGNAQTCELGSDCSSGRCDAGTCRSCSDGVKSGTESAIDCGGQCATCADGSTCNSASDCTNGRCDSGICRSCADAFTTGLETDRNCGGGVCPGCANGKGCVANTDCSSTLCIANTGCVGLCFSRVCAASPPSCTNGVKDGTEADVDCSGACVSKCGNGKTCVLASDCTSGSCQAGICATAPATCTDGSKNGNETDFNCGGGECPGCANGLVCVLDRDCASNYCLAGFCATAPPPLLTTPAPPTGPKIIIRCSKCNPQ